MRRALLATLSAAALLATMAGPAAAQNTIGSDLSKPANATFGCEMSPFQLSFGHPGVGWDPNSCTWSLTFDGQTYPPQSGTLSQVRIKSGPQTGPTRIVVLRTFYGFSNDSPPQFGNVCCSVAAATGFFTPTPNAVTTVQTDLQLIGGDTVSGAPGSEGVIDSIGISQVNQGQKIPMFDSGVRDQSGFAPVTLAWSPQHTSSEIRQESGANGLELLVQGTVTPCPNGPARRATIRRVCAPGGGGGGGTSPSDPTPGPTDPTPGPTDPTPGEPPGGDGSADAIEQCDLAKKDFKVKKLRAKRAQRAIKRLRKAGAKKRKLKRARKKLKRAQRQRRRAKLERLEACKAVDQQRAIARALEAAIESRSASD